MEKISLPIFKKSVGFTRIGPHLIDQTGQTDQTDSTKYRKYLPK